MAESVWKQRLRALVEADGRGMKAISLAAGQGETFVRDILERGRVPTIEKFMALAKTLGTTICQLTEDEPAPDSSKIADVMTEVTRRLAEIEKEIRAMKSKQ